MMALALGIILAQGAIIGLLLYFIRTFGSYTDALLRVHHENIIMRRVLAARINRLNGTQAPVDYPLDVEEVA